MKNCYQKLCAEFYDLTRPTPGLFELFFYEDLLKNNDGVALEAMCGSGRLLVPLLEKGYQIEGVDSSFDMLENCRERCNASSISYRLYHQSLQELALPRQYPLIFIALGSFQHIHDLEEALCALQKLRQHLLPGGALILETFKPKVFVDKPDTSTVTFKSTACSPEGYKIINYSFVSGIGQDVLTNHMRYEKWDKEELCDVEEEEWSVRSYSEEQMRSMLTQAGFLSIQSFDKSFELNPKATVYSAVV